MRLPSQRRRGEPLDPPNRSSPRIRGCRSTRSRSTPSPRKQRSRAIAGSPLGSVVETPPPGQIVQCGWRMCPEGEVCCNWSCSTCGPPGQICEYFCGTPSIPISIPCGPNTCNVTEVCCNRTCGICVPSGDTCSQEPCPDTIYDPFSAPCGLAHVQRGRGLLQPELWDLHETRREVQHRTVPVSYQMYRIMSCAAMALPLAGRRIAVAVETAHLREAEFTDDDGSYLQIAASRVVAAEREEVVREGRRVVDVLRGRSVLDQERDGKARRVDAEGDADQGQPSGGIDVDATSTGDEGALGKSSHVEPERCLEREHGRECLGELGRIAAHTGAACIEWCGHRAGRGFSVAGNMLAGRPGRCWTTLLRHSRRTARSRSPCG